MVYAPPRRRFPEPENLLRRLMFMPDGCIEFTGAKGPGGYGTVKSKGKIRKAHRVMWELVRGPIPEGLEIDHLCRNTACVNPGHLEPVTRAENIRRGTQGQHNAIKTHCKWGHEFTPENTDRSTPGKRGCRICKRRNVRAWYARSKMKEV